MAPPATERKSQTMVDTPSTMTALELMQLAIPEPRFAVPGLIPEGLTILAGRPKTGKSWLAYQLGIAVAVGKPALGLLPVSQGPVLYLSLEDNRRRLRDRLSKLLGPDGTVPEQLHVATEWPRADAGGVAELDSWIGNHPGTRLIIVDTLKKIRGRRSQANCNAYDQDYEDVAGIKQVADKRAVAIVVVHHTRKAEADDPVDTVSGTLGLAGGADGILILQRTRGKQAAKLFVTGRDLEESSLALQFDPAFGLWSITGDATAATVSAERRAILDLLESIGEPMTPADIAQNLGKADEKGRAAVRKILGEMMRDGQLECPERGLYVGASSQSGSQGSQPRNENLW